MEYHAAILLYAARTNAAASCSPLAAAESRTRAFIRARRWRRRPARNRGDRHQRSRSHETQARPRPLLEFHTWARRPGERPRWLPAAVFSTRVRTPAQGRRCLRLVIRLLWLLWTPTTSQRADPTQPIRDANGERLPPFPCALTDLPSQQQPADPIRTGHAAPSRPSVQTCVRLMQVRWPPQPNHRRRSLRLAHLCTPRPRPANNALICGVGANLRRPTKVSAPRQSSSSTPAARRTSPFYRSRR